MIGLEVQTAGEAGADYQPIPPLTQYKGSDPYGDSTAVTYFKLDAANVPVEIYVFTSLGERWRKYSEFLSSPDPVLPLITDKVFSDSDKNQLAFEMAASGSFKAKTEYLTVGDEVRGSAVVNLKGMLNTVDYEAMKKYFTFMPRSMLWDFFIQKIFPGLPGGDPSMWIFHPTYGTKYYHKPYTDLVWAAFVDLFNLSNLEYINSAQIDASEWERQKLDSYYVASSQEGIDAVNASLESMSDLGLALDPKAQAIMEQFAELPKLGDIGFEINRQNALRELLKKQAYVEAQAIVDIYRNLKNTKLGPLLEQPIPVSIISKTGQVLVSKTNP